jgi:hypothetical protein
MIWLWFWVIFILAVLLVLCGTFISLVVATFTGAPFVTMSKGKAERIAELAGAKKGKSAIDLGSGDGRVVAALAKRGAVAEGCEIQPLLVWWSRLLLQVSGLGSRTSVRRGNLWKIDCAPYQIVTLYGFPSMMAGLERKLQSELQPGARVVSLAFRFPNWQPAREDGNIRVYKVQSSKPKAQSQS